MVGRTPPQPSTFDDLHVLVVEDSALVSLEIERVLQTLGCRVVGPARDVASALSLIDRGKRIDLALLDVNLNGEEAFPIAERLTAGGVGYAFMTGYVRDSLPPRYKHAMLLCKPFGRRDVESTLDALSKNVGSRVALDVEAKPPPHSAPPAATHSSPARPAPSSRLPWPPSA